jgi:hypothetical protein
MGRMFPIWLTLTLAVSPGATIAKSALSSHELRTPMLAREPHFDLSRYDLVAKVGVGWPHKRNAISKSVRLAFDSGFQLFAASAADQARASRTRAIVIDAGPDAQADSALRPALDESVLDAFGRVAMLASQRSSAPAVALGDRLMQIAADQMMRDALLEVGRGVSTRGASENLAEQQAASPQIGASQIARGIAIADATRQPFERVAEVAPAPAVRTSANRDAMEPPTMRNDVIASAAPSAAPSAARRTVAFDASEGTALDPLLNTTYDLNFPKVVPALK